MQIPGIEFLKENPLIAIGIAVAAYFYYQQQQPKGNVRLQRAMKAKMELQQISDEAKQDAASATRLVEELEKR